MTTGAIHWALSTPRFLCLALLHLISRIRRETTCPHYVGRSQTAVLCQHQECFFLTLLYAADKATEALKGPEGLNPVPDLHSHRL